MEDPLPLTLDRSAFPNGIQPGMFLGVVTETGQYVPLDLTADDGREVPAGIIFSVGPPLTILHLGGAGRPGSFP